MSMTTTCPSTIKLEFLINVRLVSTHTTSQLNKEYNSGEDTNLRAKYVLNIHSAAPSATVGSVLFQAIFTVPVVYAPLFTIR